MPPKKDTTATNGTEGAATLSARDMNLITLYLQSLPSSAKAQGDWIWIAEKAGLKDDKSARECFRQLCKKHGWFENASGNNNGDGTAAASGATPVKTPRKRAAPKSKKKDDDEDADDANGDPFRRDGDGSEETPSKKQKTGAKQDDNNDLDDFLDPTIPFA